MNLLYDTLKQNKKFKNIQCIDAELLFTASEHQFNAKKFHEFCDNKGPTLTIIHNDKNHVFGGYCTESWSTSNADENDYIDDPTAFLYVIRPTCKSYGLFSKKRSDKALMYGKDWGPLYGKHNDVWISTECNTHNNNGCNPRPATFNVNPEELIGPQGNQSTMPYYDYQCIIKEYEVFGVKIDQY